ncbi:hypothetical protein COE51_22890 [Bacillus pseudomycoides]|nr:hypothetical protein COE51_22890 [Bacillus pseudomycoides]
MISLMKARRLLFLFAFMFSFLLQPSIVTHAESVSNLKVNVTTDKQSYSENDEIKYTLTISNTSSNKAKDIVVTSTIPDGLEVLSKDVKKEKDKLVWKIDNIDAFGQANVSFTAKVKNSDTGAPPVTTDVGQNSGSIQKNTPSNGTTDNVSNGANHTSNGTAPKTGDNSSFTKYYVLLAISTTVLILALIALKKKRVKKSVTTLIVIAMILPSFTAAKAEELKETVKETHTVTVNNKEYTLTINVEAVIDVKDSEVSIDSKTKEQMNEFYKVSLSKAIVQELEKLEKKAEWMSIEKDGISNGSIVKKIKEAIQNDEVLSVNRLANGEVFSEVEELTTRLGTDEEKQRWNVISLAISNIALKDLLALLSFEDNVKGESGEKVKKLAGQANEYYKEAIITLSRKQFDKASKASIRSYETSLLAMKTLGFVYDFTVDIDKDDLNNMLELGSKTNPLKEDTDKDTLPDGYELGTTNTSPLLKDSDNNGKEDSVEDPDGDLLTNKEEYELGSDPKKEDTDDDSLNDKDEMKYKTSLTDEDTDKDGLKDGMEIQLGTNPLQGDSNNNGTNDGDEQYTITTTVTKLEKDDKVQPSVTITGIGKDVSSTRITNIEGTLQNLNENIPGYLGAPFEFKTDVKFSKAVMNFSYDSSLGKEGEPFRPEIFYYNEGTNRLERLPDQKVDLTNATVTAEVSHFSKYILLNGAKWDEAWEKELQAPKTEQDKETYVDVVFSIDSSGSMGDNDPEDIRKKAAKNFVDKLKEQDRSAVVDFDNSAETTVQLTTDKGKVKLAIDQIDSFGGTNLYNGLSEAISEIKRNGQEGHYKYIIFLTDGDGYYDNSVLKEAKKNNIVIYTIGLGSGVKENILQEIANTTGGKYYFASEAGQLEDAFDHTADDTVDFFNDDDKDGIVNYYEKNGLRIETGEWITKLNYQNPDSDGDGLLDGDELGNYNQKGRYFEYTSRPDLVDSDKDGLSDKEDREKLTFNVTDQLLSYISDAAYINVEDHIRKNIDSLDIRDLFSARSLGKKEFNELDGWKILDAEDSHVYDSGLGMLFLKKGNVIVTAFRGTELTKESPELLNDVLLADGLLFLTGTNPQVMFARKRVANMVLNHEDTKVYVTGHSLGGFIAQIIGSEFVDNRIGKAFWSIKKTKKVYDTIAQDGYYQRTTTFNAPGSATTPIFYSPSDQEDYKKTITNYVMYNKKDDEEDLVGSLGYKLGKKVHIEIEDEIEGLMGRHGISFFMKDPISKWLRSQY